MIGSRTVAYAQLSGPMGGFTFRSRATPFYTLCERDGNDSSLAYIPSDFTEEPSKGFDPVYMSKLFERGYPMTLEVYPWRKGPPSLIASP